MGGEGSKEREERRDRLKKKAGKGGKESEWDDQIRGKTDAPGYMTVSLTLSCITGR